MEGFEEVIRVEEDFCHSKIERGVFGQGEWMYTTFIEVESLGLLEEVKAVWEDVETVLYLGILEIGGVFASHEFIEFNN